MEIRDIVNRDLVNLVNCESEPIHIPGSIQPHGFLIALDASTFQTVFCSANVADFLGKDPADLLGKTFSEIFGKEQLEALAAYSSGTINTAQPFVLRFKEELYNTTVHRSGSMLILEAEPFPDGTLDLPNLYMQTSNFVSFMEGSPRFTDLSKDIAEETRAITGYDRVMIYRFDEFYNGEVIAESKREDLESFAGQKYPHTDVPAQARELYIRNQMRMIADVNYEPVPLLTNQTDLSNKSLDLSVAVLRSVSPVHIEYLKNMGIGATLTVSLLLDKKLWGLIACHHYSPKILPHYRRLSALLQGHFLTSQIKVREAAEDFETAQKAEAHLKTLMGLLLTGDDFISSHYNEAALREVAGATSVIIYKDKRLYKSGVAPSDEDSMLLTELLTKKCGIHSYNTTSLSVDFPETASMAKDAAGVIYYPLSAVSDDCIIWIRPEIVQTIKWGGNPYEKKESLLRLTPRKSFELWVEEVKLKSRTWEKSRLAAAANFAYALEKFYSLHISRLQEERYRMLSEELKVANKELANINWISTHDLKEPLRKIQIFASLVLEHENSELPEKVKNSVTRMKVAAVRMQTLIEDILSYSQASDAEKIFAPAALNDIVKETIHDLHEETTETQAQISFGELPVIDGIPFQLKQLFVNLISNSLKFIAKDTVPLIRIEASAAKGNMIGDEKAKADADYHKLTVTDNGVGFDQQYAQQIFEVFKRLHTVDEYRGTGIGLAICKKIMQNHSGFIKAASAPGKGTVMSLYFPVKD